MADEATPATPQDDEAAHEAARRAVEAAKAELGFGARDFGLPNEPEVTWEAAYDPATEPHATVEESAPVASNDDEDAREAVRRAVEELKAEMAQGEVPAADVEPVDDEEAAREAVRRAVEEAKAERAFAAQPSVVTTLDEEEAAREAVRQAVLQARTEIATTGSLSEEPPEPVEVAPAYVVPPPQRADRTHPPTITIEDPEGRVELARVYNLLKALDCAANSSLLNYSSRQVSVQLSDNQAPSNAVVAEAVKDVFEREPEVQADGVNVIVKLGSDYIRAA
jgi:hypothetical protein